MNDSQNITEPKSVSDIWKETVAIGFKMASDPLTCSLLRTLAATKQNGNFLELGSGTGLSTAWILDGMNTTASLTTLDNNKDLLEILEKHLGNDPRLSVICTDGDEWIEAQHHTPIYDFIFADTWAGKYRLLRETLAMIKPGGFYIIDDMTFREDWPEGHAEKAEKLIEHLESRNDFHISKLSWASGVIIAVKK